MNFEQIQKEKRLMSRETLVLLKRAARKVNCTEDSLLWILTDVFSNGSLRSHAFNDVPPFVMDDGLVVERDRGILAYTPWAFTDKTKKILTSLRDA